MKCWNDEASTHLEIKGFHMAFIYKRENKRSVRRYILDPRKDLELGAIQKIKDWLILTIKDQ